MKQTKELITFNFILEYYIRCNNSTNKLLRRLDYIVGIVKDTLLLILYNKLQNIK